MISPLLAEAVEDPQLRGAPLHVLLFLHKVLEYGEYREIKHWVIAEKTKLSRRNVSRAIKHLVGLGYLRAGPTKERNIGSYMLLGSRHSVDMRRFRPPAA